MHDLLAALCLVLVIEGLFLFAAPGVWKRMAEQMQQLDAARLRVIGGVLAGIGLLALQLVR
jgi:uncharacterized protein YjeT (DUF2065 family)